MVRNFDAPVAINEGHGPVFYDCGQVVELKRCGDTLCATLEVPADVAKEVSIGLYPAASVELAEHNNRLVGLALLVDHRSAVVGLAPIGKIRE